MTSLTDMPADIVEAATAAYLKQLEEREDSAPFYTAGEFKDVQVGHIARAILAERQRDQWQPIDTAPKDGTKILLLGGVYHGMPFAGCWELSPYSPDLPWKNLVNNHRLYEHCATHWMPLPSPPKGS